MSVQPILWYARLVRLAKVVFAELYAVKCIADKAKNQLLHPVNTYGEFISGLHQAFQPADTYIPRDQVINKPGRILGADGGKKIHY